MSNPAKPVTRDGNLIACCSPCGTYADLGPDVNVVIEIVEKHNDRFKHGLGGARWFSAVHLDEYITNERLVTAEEFQHGRPHRESTAQRPNRPER